MGQSTDAILWYGFEYGEMPPWGDADDEEWMASALGEEPPTTEYNEYTCEEYRAYWTRKRAVIKTAGVEIVTHCSGDYPMHGLGVLVITSYRGDPHDVTNHIAQDTAEAAARLKDFCKKAGLEWTEPRWHLASHWN